MAEPVITVRQPGAVEGQTVGFDASDRGLLLADGVFDTSLVHAGAIVLKDRHFERLISDAAALGISIARADIEASARSVLGGASDGALRLTVTRGPGKRGLGFERDMPPTLMARFDPGAPAFPLDPVKLTVSDIARNPSAPSSRHKTLAYTDNIVGQSRAKAAGFDEALYLTPGGAVACASSANIFIRFGNDLVTPPIEDGVLAGVTRRWLIDHAPEAGFRVSVRSIGLKETARADAVYLTSSLQRMRAVSRLDEADFDIALPPELVALFDQLLANTDTG